MSSQRDPERLSHSADPDFHELVSSFESARARGPSADQLARLAAGLAAQPDPRRNGEPEAAGTPTQRWLLKLLGGGVLALALALGVALKPREHSRAPQPEPRPHGPPSAAVQPPNEPPKISAAGAAATQPEIPAVQPGRSARRAQRPTPIDAAAELALLERARANVRSAPQLALELVREHARRFDKGVLSEEREVIAIEALLVLHRTADAEQRAQAFGQHFPGSAHARRVRTLFAQHATEDSVEIVPAVPHPVP